MLKRIKTIPLLENIPEKELKEFTKKGHLYLKQYTKGVTVYEQRSTCETLDIVIDGAFIAYSLAENGSIMTVFEFSKGRALGANLLFGDNNTYPLTIYCSEKGTLLHISKRAVMSFLYHYDFSLKFIGSISQNSQGLNSRMTMTTQKTLRENILDYLSQQSLLQNSMTVILPMSKKQLADYFGVRRPSLFREFKKLSDEGFIIVQNRTVQITSRAKKS